MARLAGIAEADLSPEQRALQQAILDGPRPGAAGSRRLADDAGRLAGPFNAWLRNPRLGTAWSAVGETLRFATGIPRAVFEAVVATVAAHYRCDYEWAAHRRLAEQAGVDPHWLEALAADDAPPPSDPAMAAAVAAARAMLTSGRIDAAAYADLLARFGESGAFEVVSTVAYYAGLALQLNAFAVDPPEGFVSPWDSAG